MKLRKKIYYIVVLWRKSPERGDLDGTPIIVLTTPGARTIRYTQLQLSSIKVYKKNGVMLKYTHTGCPKTHGIH
jgi:hypothetical protein